jgi:hypothetical protein
MLLQPSQHGRPMEPQKLAASTYAGEVVEIDLVIDPIRGGLNAVRQLWHRNQAISPVFFAFTHS